MAPNLFIYGWIVKTSDTERLEMRHSISILLASILLTGTVNAQVNISLLNAKAELVAAAPSRNTGRFSYNNLLKVAKRAQSGASRDCYNTSARTAGLNGGSTDGWGWPESTTYRGQSLASGLEKAIANGELKPGMIIYANNRPGADPSSMNMAYKPHWFTYLGKDASGVDRFSDQYATDFDLSGPRGIAATYGGSRVIDAFYDPYRR